MLQPMDPGITQHPYVDNPPLVIGVKEGEGEVLMRVTRSFRARLEDGTAGDEASCEQLFRRVG